MKKVGLILCALAVGSLFAAQTVGVASQAKTTPADVWAVKLHTKNTATSLDTFANGDIKTYGPYPLSTPNGAMAKSFQTVGSIITGTTPTMALDYCFTTGTALSDTDGVWNTQDTLAATAQVKYTALTSVAAEGIVFRINNYDGTACQIPEQITVMFKAGETFNK